MFPQIVSESPAVVGEVNRQPQGSGAWNSNRTVVVNDGL